MTSLGQDAATFLRTDEIDEILYRRRACLLCNEVEVLN